MMKDSLPEAGAPTPPPSTEAGELEFLGKTLKPRPLSRLSYRIMSLNIIMLSVLAMSFSYLGQMRTNLLNNELSNLSSETRLYSQLFALFLETGWQDSAELSTDFLRSINPPDGQILALFDAQGHRIAAVGDIPLRSSYLEKTNRSLDLISRGIALLQDMVSVNFNLQTYPGLDDMGRLKQAPSAEETVDGLRIAAWSAPDGGLILTSEYNVEENGRLMGRVLLVRRDLKIEDAFSNTRLDVLRFFVISLALTLSISLYLSGLIGHPLRVLASAAEAFRLNRGRDIDIPDLSHRKDEIGELSHAMREMAVALRRRLVSIERFAADVAHELKNPLTSLKSAAETLSLVKKDDDRARLISIVLHDIERMNRLISDISLASRLDAEVAREQLVRVDLREIIMALVAARANPIDRGGGSPISSPLDVRGLDSPLYVMGIGGRLAQVFDNLIANALSFSPPDCVVRINVETNADRVKITIDDDGPGIPAGSLEKIFERFYSERPLSEGFGLHSGLGLSIAKQIIEAHNGTIYAENRLDGHRVVGARFIVRLRPWEV